MPPAPPTSSMSSFDQMPSTSGGWPSGGFYITCRLPLHRRCISLGMRQQLLFIFLLLLKILREASTEVVCCNNYGDVTALVIVRAYDWVMYSLYSI